MLKKQKKNILYKIYYYKNQNTLELSLLSPSTRVGSAGVVRRQSCDVSPFRRVNQALYLMVTGARASSFRNVKTISECLADEIVNASKSSPNSFAIKKKDEIERVAKANR